ncbi:response regulator transcription factor [Mucilaginibacter sp. ZT4R22]|uniref:Response regulator transcription factor n=1 Tax=Mucilaginibacter pankratovii TaxID=2772110 RepID=A0ABR7WPL5_9SPHI|nr:LytTR family DNA-binding domain-containing protein [Mucilaginibacter pankratovii]MBD1364259.1 response regulator transcription factor [Mucilaginibacter pankratovii]
METPLTIVVVDDEPLAREVLEAFLKKITGIQSVYLFPNARAALNHLEKQAADLLLLDIEMPEMTGIEFLKQLPDPPLTIFTTAYRNYAFDGYELGVIDFLLKPIGFDRFALAISKAREFLALKEQQSHMEDGPGDDYNEFVFVKSGVQRIKLHFAEVTHIQGLKDYAIIYTSDKKILLKGSVKAMLDIFPTDRFIRVHKSFIVNLQKVTQLERNHILLKGHQIPVGRNFKEELERALRAK